MILRLSVILACLFLPVIMPVQGALANARQAAGEHPGEEMAYEVIFGGIRLGEAKSQYMGSVKLNGKTLNQLIFKTRVINFSDTENIYSDPYSHLPVRIERDVANFFGREKITEDYDQINYRVTISKNKEQLVFEGSGGPLHNAILFPYFVRRVPGLKVGMVFVVNLPGKAAIKVKLVSIDKIKTSAGSFEAFHFESTPKQIAVWISTDERRIPVKIEGAGVFGYSLVLKSYKP